ncbi:regulator of telomere elongation helicase 1 isoform X2 [Denticeps clupeoides]|uniref:regulator of telomere elongation helicase 1 isoform X2 n=1 Tax=Denticeps clupeoides TaxID=299321 RepID=UPI0010A52ACF|nr:regulator of telomere elongation helicase 1 isoform X2 [Denticeps clupeoides]
MPPLTLKGVKVDFPFTPYPCQQDYMNKVIECLQNRVNGILESPTGTGKTLCLLCATLGWRDNFKDTISARKIAQKMGGAELFPGQPLASWGTGATDGDATAYYTDVPKIIYASRTHSQLTQVINELKNTSYRPKVCVLGSREQLCINSEVMRQESNHIKVHMCRAKVSTRSCMFYNNVEEKSTDKDLVNAILDVEDLVKAGNKQRVCPYYLSRTLKQNADIIFMPYNYLLDPKSRRAHNIELKGAIVIFDEAHNVMCEESTSFDLTPYDLTSAMQAVDRLLLEQAKDLGKGDAPEDFNMESGSSGLKLDITSIAKIKQIIMDLEAAINSYEMPSNSQGITKPGSFIYELFQKAQVTFETKAAIVEAMEQITGYLAGQPGIFLNTSGLQKLADIIQLVFSNESTEGSTRAHLEKNSQQFKVHIHQDNSSHRKKQNTDVWSSASSKKQGNVLSYWCFSPGFSMQELVRQDVRCIILTSGTLSPISSFTAEMQIPFPVCLENPHVIERDQIFVSIIDRGPDGVQLSSAFDRRFDPDNMGSLGNTVVNLGRVVPHGLLVFFPSYPVMDKTLEFWKSNGHGGRIENLKPMFVEPKGKGTFTEIIDGYYSKVNDPSSRGGSFFAVCRGKASEGLDFADTYGRGVIITGLPFPPRMDPRVVLKMQYLDEMCRKKVAGLKYLSGQDWYRQQASRAVNQAIGRVIRHREDYGAIFLCDHRFKSSDARAQLPAWVKPYVRTYDSFGNVVRDVAQFFRVAQKLRPLPQKKTAAPLKNGLPCGDSTSGLGPGTTPHSWPSCSAQKAKVLDSHVPSLKRRRIDCPDDQATAGGSARLCIQYEAEMSASKKRPLGLLDALDYSDHPTGSETAVLTGEEKADRLSTLSLQHDKRMDDEARGGKRRIKVVQGPRSVASLSLPEDSKMAKGRTFMLDLKKNLSHDSFTQLMHALQLYKNSDDLEELVAKGAELLTRDPNTHSLLRGLYQFIRPHHKKRFHEHCVLLTGDGCGYKPEHSLSKEQKETLKHHTADGVSSDNSAVCSQLDSSQLNKGGSHLKIHSSSGGKCGGQPLSNISTDSDISSALFADIKKAIGTQKTNQLFVALQTYKKNNDYENMVATVVSLLTEKDENFGLLKRLAQFIPSHHRQQFLKMLASLSGKDMADGDCSPQGLKSSAGKSQTKISTFFS